MNCPFIIYALPRSRTAWLADFLTYRDWKCHHEAAITFRSPDEISSFFTGNVGAAETGAAQGWRLIKHYVPHIRTVVVRRPVDEVVNSLLALDLGDMTYDASLLRRNMEYGDRMLERISAQPDTLILNYADLESEQTCSTIFDHCLPYRFDREWWLEKQAQNIQADARKVIMYYHQNRDAVEGFKRACKDRLRALARAGVIRSERMPCHQHQSQP